MNNIKEDTMKIIDADELMNDINNALNEMTKTTNFCPNCGVDMRGEKDE